VVGGRKSVNAQTVVLDDSNTRNDEMNMMKMENEINDETKMSPRHPLTALPTLPTVPNTVPNENRTRGSSATNVSVRMGLDASVQSEKIRRSGAGVEKVGKS